MLFWRRAAQGRYGGSGVRQEGEAARL